MLITPKVRESFLSAPSAFFIDHGQGVLGQDYPLGFVPGALRYDHGIADLSGLGYDAMAVDLQLRQISKTLKSVASGHETLMQKSALKSLEDKFCMLVLNR